MPDTTTPPLRAHDVPSTELAKTAPAPELAKSDRVPVQFAATPRTIEEGWRLATIFAKSNIVPADYHDHPENIFVALQLGAELGLAPMQALQSICVINGRPSVWGDGFLALLMKSPVYAGHEEYYEVGGKRTDRIDGKDLQADSTAAVCTFRRHPRANAPDGAATQLTRRFSIGQAKKAELWTKKGTWQTYPDRMLMFKARSWAGRDLFPDVLRGLVTAEEAEDLPIVRVTPQPPQVRRLSDPPPDAPAAEVQPTAIPITLDAATISKIEQFLGGCTLTLDNGTEVDVTEVAEALALENTMLDATKVRITVLPVAGRFQFQSYRVEA
jgi:hypothetical protein